MNAFKCEMFVTNRALFVHFHGTFDAFTTENMTANRRMNFTISDLFHAHRALE